MRDLVRELSAALGRVMKMLPPESALALARGEEADARPPLVLEGLHETVETTRADVATEMALLWKRVSPRESS